MRIGRGSSVKTKKKFDLKINRIVKNGKDGVIICTGPTVVIAYNISQILNTNIKNISVKATTTDHLGIIGSGNGISATSIVMLKKINKHES